jgi:hypothetical protein
MNPTRFLLSQTLRLTLFTRVNCSLCDTAKNTVKELQKRRQFIYSEVDVMVPENKMWKDIYEFDVPVLHVQRTLSPKDHSEKPSVPRKLFHRFTEEEVEKTLDEAIELT